MPAPGYDFRPGQPGSAAVPARATGGGAARGAARTEASAFEYPDVRGAPAHAGTLVAYLPRRGAPRRRATRRLPGVGPALALAARALRAGARAASRSRTLEHRNARRPGASADLGADARAGGRATVPSIAERSRERYAVLVTPAHQFRPGRCCSRNAARPSSPGPSGPAPSSSRTTTTPSTATTATGRRPAGPRPGARRLLRHRPERRSPPPCGSPGRDAVGSASRGRGAPSMHSDHGSPALEQLMLAGFVALRRLRPPPAASRRASTGAAATRSSPRSHDHLPDCRASVARRRASTSCSRLTSTSGSRPAAAASAGVGLGTMAEHVIVERARAGAHPRLPRAWAEPALRGRRRRRSSSAVTAR